MTESPRRNAFERAMTAFARTPFGYWMTKMTSSFFHILDRRLVKGGGKALSAALTGTNVGVLHVTGHKSGLPRDTPLIFVPNATAPDSHYVFASNFGREGLPAWYHNLKASTNPTVTLGGKTFPVTVAELDAGPEYDAAWSAAVAHYNNYATYQDKLQGARHIPILRLERGTTDT
jgi:deazaflavin-dependent oxidoreductase (nitroreductase family)